MSRLRDAMLIVGFVVLVASIASQSFWIAGTVAGGSVIALSVLWSYAASKAAIAEAARRERQRKQ